VPEPRFGLSPDAREFRYGNGDPHRGIDARLDGVPVVTSERVDEADATTEEPDRTRLWCRVATRTMVAVSRSAPELPVGVPGPGDIIAEKYRVDRLLGVGGMGAVVAATHLQLDDRVAIKVLLPELASDRDLVDRFLREGRAAVRIRSEHVGRVLDVGTVTPGGTPCIVMEYLEGKDLSQLLEERGTLPPEEAVDYVLQATEAIAEAHKAGIVHRDLKPANLFLTHRADGSPCIKVLDFGIAKVVRHGEAANVTKTRMQMGSPLYMAPEQLRSSRNVDARTDIWALGAVLHELVTGAPPFTADTLAELAIITATEPAPRMVERCPLATAALQDVVDRCLQKEPDGRFESVASFAQAAAAAVDSRAGLASAQRVGRVLGAAAVAPQSRPVVVVSANLPDATGLGVTARPWSKTLASKGGRRTRVIAGAAVGALAIALLVGRAALRHGDGAAPAAAQPEPTAAATMPAPTASPAIPKPVATQEQPLPAPRPDPSITDSASAAPQRARTTPTSTRAAQSTTKPATTTPKGHVEDLH
jgi:eukaryotic-like serine/threonine-protein kinase